MQPRRGPLVYEVDYADGKYPLMMLPMGCLLVEGTADLKDGVNAYSLNVISVEDDLPDDITLDNLVGTKDGVSGESSMIENKYFVECSPDGFEHTMRSVSTVGNERTPFMFYPNPHHVQNPRLGTRFETVLWPF